MKHVTIIGGSRLYANIVKKVLRDVCKVVRCSKRTPAVVIFVSDAKMRELNRTYRGKNKTTNVLAFEGGDIFISLPEARREAKKYGWTIRYEIARLALHGYLHLLGYDHKKDKEAGRMERLEAKILKEL